MAVDHEPPPCGPQPSVRQLAWHELEFYGFLHFTVNTFTDQEWGYGDEDPQLFAPTDFDASQIVEVADNAGMQGLILTAKHHDGFCLWPSAHTEHSVRHCPWLGGKGDMVGDLASACAKRGLRFGIYLSPWDRHHAAYSTPDYVDYYRAQLRELLTQYGDIFEVWHDGANGGDGYYGGARENRTIDKTTYYGWQQTWDLIRQLQPEAVVFSDVGPDVRWVGNESGLGSETTWLGMRTEGWSPGDVITEQLGEGHEDGDRWLPPEIDVSIRPGWFYHTAEDDQVKSGSRLVEIWEQSVGRSGSLLLNMPPDRRGHIHESDVASLRQMRQTMDATYGVNLATAATVTASNVRGNLHSFAAGNTVDGDATTYWATDDGITTATLEIELPQETRFDRVEAREVIRLGQRVQRWSVQAQLPGGDWQTLATATTMGARRVLPTPPTTARRLRLRIDAARASPTIGQIGLYRSP